MVLGIAASVSGKLSQGGLLGGGERYFHSPTPGALRTSDLLAILTVASDVECDLSIASSCSPASLDEGTLSSQ
jgi:hypothetical protein